MASASKSIPSAIPPQQLRRSHKVIPSHPGIGDSDVAESHPMSESRVRSYARANQELAASFDRYLLSRGASPETRITYAKTVGRLNEMLGSQSLAGADRS